MASRDRCKGSSRQSRRIRPGCSGNRSVPLPIATVMTSARPPTAQSMPPQSLFGSWRAAMTITTASSGMPSSRRTLTRTAAIAAEHLGIETIGDDDRSRRSKADQFVIVARLLRVVDDPVDAGREHPGERKVPAKSPRVFPHARSLATLHSQWQAKHRRSRTRSPSSADHCSPRLGEPRDSRPLSQRERRWDRASPYGRERSSGAQSSGRPAKRTACSSRTWQSALRVRTVG